MAPVMRAVLALAGVAIVGCIVYLVGTIIRDALRP
jgi:hypothetical protein